MSLVIEQPDAQADQTPKEPVTIEGLQKNLYIALAVLVIVALGSVVYFYDTLFIAEETRLTPEQVFKQLLVSGDFDAALALLPPGGTGEPTEQFVRFMSALPAEQLKAAQLAEESYRLAEGNPVVQASHLNTIIEQLLVSRDKDLYDYFFREGSPLVSMKKDTIDASAVALAEYGMTLRPTSVSQVVLSLPHITAVNVAKSLTAKGVSEHITEGIAKVEAAVALNEAEMKNMAVGDTYRAQMRMLTWKSSMYGAAALKDPQYLPKLKENADQAVALYQQLVAANGRDNYLEARIPPILVTYAGVMSRLGDEYDADTDGALEKIVGFVQKNPQMHEAVFVATAKRLAAQKADDRGYQYSTYKLLAAENDAFKGLLAQFGLTF
ncbi:MAG: hypothetical protein KBE09_00215 [Candidatus Pacebacteria bacterium]|nr:hypothetical protein [Candidatus Paceibacterota bacterium]